MHLRRMVAPAATQSCGTTNPIRHVAAPVDAEIRSRRGRESGGESLKGEGRTFGEFLLGLVVAEPVCAV
jgi:hypothetical protein